MPARDRTTSELIDSVLEDGFDDREYRRAFLHGFVGAVTLVRQLKDRPISEIIEIIGDMEDKVEEWRHKRPFNESPPPPTQGYKQDLCLTKNQ